MKSTFCCSEEDFKQKITRAKISIEVGSLTKELFNFYGTLNLVIIEQWKSADHQVMLLPYILGRERC
jgi:hypothetical protein